MNERIKELRKVLGLTLDKFGGRLGVGKSAISKIERGENGVTDQLFKSICREFNINETWLREGTGEMFASMETEYHTMIDRVMKGERENVKNVFKTFVTFDESDWDALDRMIEKYSTIAFGETAAALFSDIPDTAEELEKQFPPVEPTKKHTAV